MQERLGMNPTHSSGPGVPDGSVPTRRRRLRAVFAADIANFGGMVTIDETNTLDALLITRQVAIEELDAHRGWLFGLPGDGIFALFESTVDAVRCALRIQARLAESPKLHAVKLRIGVHLGEVLFQDDLPCGEALVIASRLESLAEPGGILVSASVVDAVAPRIAATFVESGVPTLKHSPRRIETFRVLPPPPTSEPHPADALLDRTVASEFAPPHEPTPRSVLAEASALPRMPKATPLVLPGEMLANVVSPSDDAPLPMEHVAKEPVYMAPVYMVPVSSTAVFAPPPEVPAKVEKSTEAQSPTAGAAGLDDASLGRLVLLLTTHLGPVAKVLVRRKAAENPDAAQLIEILAQEIPAKGERLKFLTGARALLAGPH